MKTYLSILVILLSFSVSIQAQKSSKKLKLYKVWITLINDTKVQGHLYAADDTSIKITEYNSLDVSNLTTIDSKHIDIIKMRRKGKIGKGAWIGAISGAGIGVITGLATEDSNWQGAVATGEGIIFGIIGTGVGAAIGAIKKKIQINGNSEVYKSHLLEIQSYSLIPKNTAN